MRQQEVWFIGGPWDIVRFVGYPLRSKIIIPWWIQAGGDLVYERVGYDIYLFTGEGVFDETRS